MAEEQDACFRQTGAELKFRVMQVIFKETSKLRLKRDVTHFII